MNTKTCSATGKQITEGYVVRNGEYYFGEGVDFVKHLRSIKEDHHLYTDKGLMLYFFYEEKYYTYQQQF